MGGERIWVHTCSLDHKNALKNYLEIRSLGELKEVKKPAENYSVELADPKDFQLNKFFYKTIGKNCQWIDRLIWTDLNWTDYVSNDHLFT